MLALGIGHDIDRSELNEIASAPADKHVFMSDSFDELLSKLRVISDGACHSEM